MRSMSMRKIIFTLEQVDKQYHCIALQDILGRVRFGVGGRAPIVLVDECQVNDSVEDTIRVNTPFRWSTP
jgi:hypothetical protein